MDSTAVTRLFENLWNAAIHKDTIITNHWYSFYDDAFEKLISTHVGLFTALIAVAVSIFALKYWLDNKKFNEDFDNKIKDKLKKANDSIEIVKINSSSAIRFSYISSIKLVLKLDEEKKCTDIILGLVNAALGTDFEKKNDVVKELFNEIPEILERLKNEQNYEFVKDAASPLLIALNQAVAKDDSLTAFFSSELLQELSAKYRINPSAAENLPKSSIWQKIKKILLTKIVIKFEQD